MKQKVIDCIPCGKENSISRAELVKRTGLDDRTVREEISRLRSKGEFILSSSSHSGYWLSDDSKEIEQYFKECDSRRHSLCMASMKKRYYAMTGKKYTVVKEHIRRI